MTQLIAIDRTDLDVLLRMAERSYIEDGNEADFAVWVRVSRLKRGLPPMPQPVTDHDCACLCDLCIEQREHDQFEVTP